MIEQFTTHISSTLTGSIASRVNRRRRERGAPDTVSITMHRCVVTPDHIFHTTWADGHSEQLWVSPDRFAGLVMSREMAVDALAKDIAELCAGYDDVRAVMET